MTTSVSTVLRYALVVPAQQHGANGASFVCQLLLGGMETELPDKLVGC